MKISQLFYRENKWMKGGLAKTKNGSIINNLNIRNCAGGVEINPARECVAYSLYGAIAHLYTNEGLSDVSMKLSDAVKRYTGKAVYVAQFNDDPSTTFSDIKKVLSLANL